MLVPIDKLPEELLPGSKVLIEAQGNVSLTPTYLAVGIMRSNGSAAAGVPVRVSSAGRARELFGEGSSVANQCIAFLEHNKSVECWALPLAEPSGSAASWTLPISGTAAQAGTVSRYINGVLISVSVLAGDDATVLRAKMVAAVNSKSDLPVEASVSPTGVSLLAVCKGEYTNLRLEGTEGLGLGLTVGPLATNAAGTGRVDLAAVFAANTSERWNYFSSDIADAQALTAWHAELRSRYSPDRQIDGRLFVCLSGPVGDESQAGTMIEAAERINSPHMVLIPRGERNYQDSATISALWAATAGGIMAADPATNLRKRQIEGFLPQEQYSPTEREALLKAGIATYILDKLGQSYFDRTVTSYNETAEGARDTSYLDLFIVEVVSRIRQEINLAAETRFQGYKLAAVAGDYGSGAKVMTTAIWKSFLVGMYQEFLTDSAWVEDLDGYIESIQVEIPRKTRLEYLHEPRPIGNLLQTRGVLHFR